jgi:hypothetical protein
MKNYSKHIKLGLDSGFLILKVMVFVLLVMFVSAAEAQPEQAPAQGLLNRLIEIKYTSELYLSDKIGSAKKGTVVNKEQVDSALAIYNTLRWKIDGLVYELSADMIAANSPRSMRLLNEWCLAQPSDLRNVRSNNKRIKNYTSALNEIEELYHTNILTHFYSNAKTVNLSTNVFYLLKDSYTIIKGLSDMKTQKTMALVELLDNTRLLSPGEVGKMGK